MQVDFYNWNGNFDPSRSTYLITHGYQSSGTTDWILEMTNNLRLTDPNSNIISVDWYSGANTLNYSIAVDNTLIVGDRIAEYLINSGANPQTTQLIGHSLGAHISGIAADRYDALTGTAIDTIVGLDPAGPSFEGDWFTSAKPLSQRLDATDARRVIAFHTSETLGFDARLADLDLYVNWGDWFQPGQWNFSGNHGYAHQLYNELLLGYSFAQNTVNAAGTYFNLFDVNNNYLTGSVDVNTYVV
ncbi:MAG: hypothetical protein ACFBSE_01220 [Prochloraceae cyanobacterium]